ncbi:unannotated protein [freshwater metagenome]|uniref:Unannotated protein n=1 Tax=freshwater metagenome TaxID=449393 RepID=A0A6J7HTF5_9ZZZZ
MRRSIDDDQIPIPPVEPEDAAEMLPINWAVSVCDDYLDAGVRIQLTVEEFGAPATGLVGHLEPSQARRLRLALRSALKEIGEEVGQ